MKHRRESRKPVRLSPIAVGACLVFHCIFWGCGIKAPPVPPRQPPIPTVMELTYQMSDPNVTLTWRLPGPLSRRQANQSTFGIYRSRSGIDEPVCEGCPLVFEKVATAATVDSEDSRFSIDIPLKPGYRYVFKVRLEMDNRAGPDSNAVQFDY